MHRFPMRHAAAVLTLAAWFSAHPACVAASEDPEVAELKASLESMRKLVEEQNARIGALERQLAVTTPVGRREGGRRQDKPGVAPGTATRGTRAEALPALAGTPTSGGVTREATPAKARRSLIADNDTFQDQQEAAPRVDNLPIDPALKGFMPISGTDTLFRIGGSARMDGILDFGDNGNPNLFSPSSIPVGGISEDSGDHRSSLHTKGTRLKLDLRRPAPDNQTLRIFSEYDFFGDSESSAMSFRTRHFYGQVWNLLIGQTFSAFMDIDAWPDVADYQGPNGITNRRQPQLRYTHPLIDGDETRMTVFASLEQPDSRIETDADGRTSTPLPDGVLGWRLEGEPGHLQVASLLRQLACEDGEGGRTEAVGWGLSASGALKVLEKDKLFAQISYGEGIARYINDLGGLRLDAALDGESLEPLPVFAAMLGYTHHWSGQWRSTVTGGWTDVDSGGLLGSDAVDQTLYGSLNLMWHPTSSFRTGLEYLYGFKDTVGDGDADAHRFNFVIRYDLVR